MKVYLIGHKGWIGQKYLALFKEQGIDCVYSDFRAESDEIKEDIMKQGATHVLSCIGRTHGTRDGQVFNTIDYLQCHNVLRENVNDNLYTPLALALFCQKKDLHFAYIGTGCIFTYDDEHSLENQVGFTEESKPNYFASNYSVVKGFTDMLLKDTPALNLRIRMPITDEIHPRNFVTKITKYERICSVPNSMSVLTDLIPLSIKMMKEKKTGTYNFTNPGSISHNEVLQMYKEIVDPDFTWKNFSYEEQQKILLAGRSNNLLDTNKLEKYAPELPDIQTSMRSALEKMRTRKQSEQ